MIAPSALIDEEFGKVLAHPNGVRGMWNIAAGNPFVNILLRMELNTEKGVALNHKTVNDNVNFSNTL